MSLKERIENRLRPDLLTTRLQISEYSDLPFAILVYDPTEEFELREHLELLDRHLYKHGHFLRQINLAGLLWELVESEGLTEALFDAERQYESDPREGLDIVQKTIHNLLTDTAPLVDRLKERLNGMDPENEVAILIRAGSLFRLYRTSALLENLKGVMVPTILCYPGKLHGAKALSFMGKDEPDTNYRPRIY